MRKRIRALLIHPNGSTEVKEVPDAEIVQCYGMNYGRSHSLDAEGKRIPVYKALTSPYPVVSSRPTSK